MYCPKCSQPLSADEVRFCSRCGLPLTGLTQMVLANGEAKTKIEATPRQKGIRQGLILISLSLILIPAYILLAALFPANDRLVESAVSDTPFEKISQALLLTLFCSDWRACSTHVYSNQELRFPLKALRPRNFRIHRKIIRSPMHTAHPFRALALGARPARS